MCVGYVKYYTVLHKGLEHLQIRGSSGVLEQVPTPEYQGTTVCRSMWGELPMQYLSIYSSL